MRATDRTVGIIGLAMGCVIGMTGARAEDGCAKLNLTGGPECSSLKGEFDVSGCGIGAKKARARIKCSDGQTIARGAAKNSKFAVTLIKGSGAWGGGEWQASGPVLMETEHAAAPAHGTSHEGHSATAATVAKAPSTAKFTPPGGVAVHADAPAAAAEAAHGPAPAAETPPAAPALAFSAFFDAYYAHNFNRPAPVTSGATLPVPQNQFRAYDFYSNQLGLNLVELTAKATRKDTALLVDFDFGHIADFNAGADLVSKHIGQAILSYTPGWAPGLTLEAGKMATHVGLEVIKSKDNWNYSRSLLFAYGIPLWHTGFHAGYEVLKSKLWVNGYVYQGWNTLYDNNSAPTLGAQVKFNPTDALSLIYNYLGGPEQALNNDNQKRVHDFNATYTVSPTLALALDVITGSEEGITFNGGADAPIKATWSALQVGAKWQGTTAWSVSPRWEIYNDPQGYTLYPVGVLSTTLGSPDGQTMSSYTLTNSFQVSEGFETRLELRLDHSSKADRFVTKDGTSSNQTTALIAFLYTL